MARVVRQAIIMAADGWTLSAHSNCCVHHRLGRSTPDTVVIVRGVHGMMHVLYSRLQWPQMVGPDTLSARLNYCVHHRLGRSAPDTTVIDRGVNGLAPYEVPMASLQDTYRFALQNSLQSG